MQISYFEDQGRAPMHNEPEQTGSPDNVKIFDNILFGLQW